VDNHYITFTHAVTEKCHVPVLRATFCLLALTLVSACDSLRSPTDAYQPAGAVRYSAVGASDAIGYGASVACDPFVACPNGTGYVQTVSRRLKEAHADYDERNLGIPGAVLSRRIQELGLSIGRDVYSNFIDSQMPFVLRESTVITVFTGGNDTNTVGAAVRAGRGGANVEGYIDAQIASFAQDFQALIDGIRSRAATATVVVLNLPNMARLPYNAGLNATEREWMRRLAVGYSASMNGVRSANTHVVDLMCHAPIYNPGIYSADGFHPNDSGYAILADMVSTALASPPAAPATSCSFMN
jgi:lysophospholipase L1-like esterase